MAISARIQISPLLAQGEAKPNPRFPSFQSIKIKGNGLSQKKIEKLLNIEKQKMILGVVQSFSKTRELYEQACNVKIKRKTGPWKIEFRPFEELVPQSGADACVSYKRRTIYISSDVPFPMALSMCVFELANAVQYPISKNIDDRIRSINCERFAWEKERMEFVSTSMHKKIISQAVQERGWNKEMNFYADLPDTFQEFWNKTQKYTPHANYFRDAWHKRRGGNRLECNFCYSDPLWYSFNFDQSG